MGATLAGVLSKAGFGRSFAICLVYSRAIADRARGRRNAMSTMPTILSASEDDILSVEPSDEALEAAAALRSEAQAMSFSFCTSPYVCPWWR
jgi:hypothetical protein